MLVRQEGENEKVFWSTTLQNDFACRDGEGDIPTVGGTAFTKQSQMKLKEISHWN